MKGQTFLKMVERSKLNLRHASPTVLTILSIAGVIGTAILASKATLEYKKYLDDIDKPHRREEGIIPNPTAKEKAIYAAKTYAPTIAVGAATILSCAGANYLNTKRIAGLTAGYAMLAKGYKDFEKKATELIGEGNVAAIKRAITIDSAKEKKIEKPTNTNNGEILTYYEEFQDYFFELEKSTVIEAEYAVNRRMAEQGYVSLNTFYEYLGLRPIDIGDEIGWSYGVGADYLGYSWIDFKHQIFEIDDGFEAIQIEYPYPPEPGFMN